jgi:hypothetical protein
MPLRACPLVVCLAFASVAGAETVYKYRGADGRTTYSNRLVPGAELIEAFDYKFAPPVAARKAAAQSDAAGEARIRKHLAALDQAWAEVQEATRALALAESRLAAGTGPMPEEGVALGGPSTPAPLAAGESPLPGVLVPAAPEVGGRQAPGSPAVGGPQPVAAPMPGQSAAQAAAASRAVGGPMGTRRGGGRNADYVDRIAILQADVASARNRLDTAVRNYNQLR